MKISQFSQHKSFLSKMLTIACISWSDMLKSNTSPFSRILSSLTDFGMHTNPCWMHQRISNWATVFPYLQIEHILQIEQTAV